MSRWMTPLEAAEYAKISESTLRRWIGEGLIKPSVTKNKKDVTGPGTAGYVIDSRDIDIVLEGLKQDVSISSEPGRTNLDRRLNRSRNTRRTT